MTRKVVARPDPELHARIVRRTPLYYEPGGRSDIETPEFVRSASSLAQFGGRVAVIANDANFVALIDLRTGTVECISLPAGHQGSRQFDEAHDNRRWKFDLEACVTLPDESGELLVAFGSGSGPERENVVAMSRDGDEQSVQIYEAGPFYESLRAAVDFAGSDLNVEGAIFVGTDTVRLFQRGNGKLHDGLQPVDATCDLPWSAVQADLEASDTSLPPTPDNIVQYELGNLDGVRLSFSDAELVGEHVLYSASAEAQPEGDGDGHVAGSVLGIIGEDGAARWTPLITPDGTHFEGKIEGLSVEPGDPNRAYFVVDEDDSEKPSELYEVELSGPWFAATDNETSS